MTHTNHKPVQLRRPQPQGGFTLVEIMVGLAIGMLATLVIMQVLSVFEVQKRQTTGASDALTNGNLALFNVVRDVQDAGFPLVPLSPSNSPLMCATPIFVDAAISAKVTDIAPVTITDGGGGASDTIVVRYGSTSMSGTPTVVTSLAGKVATLASTLGCQNGDVTLAMNGAGSCALSTASAVTASSSSIPGTVTLGDATAAGNLPTSTLSCLGVWHEVTYAVTNDILMRTDMRSDLAAASAVPNTSDIVNIQAQYGISAAPSFNVINQWVDATGSFAAPISVTNRGRIKAVRIAVVARDAKLEPGTVTDPCGATAPYNVGPCTWASATSAAAPAVDLSSDTNWQRYRYRVFETTIPLRNVALSRPYLTP